MTRISYALTRIDAGRIIPVHSLRGPRGNQNQHLYKKAIGFHSNSLTTISFSPISDSRLIIHGYYTP
ncbi:hypothetical protein HanPI659440_Chr06g0219081 [Helianthus annuus]|nr:hypothetical protein HanIR_Chr02g0082651 [Helianthus annuus]KAJ0778757.1 hypothetical protein HanPI659440_Chr06g0219081 [Helianthus annuus]